MVDHFFDKTDLFRLMFTVLRLSVCFPRQKPISDVGEGKQEIPGVVRLYGPFLKGQTEAPKSLAYKFGWANRHLI